MDYELINLVILMVLFLAAFVVRLMFGQANPTPKGLPQMENGSRFVWHVCTWMMRVAVALMLVTAYYMFF